MVLLAGILVAAPISGSLAQVMLPSPLLPPESDPPDCEYLLLSVYHSGGTKIYYHFGYETYYQDYITHKCFTSVVRTAVGNDELEDFNSIWECILYIDDHYFVTMTGPVQTLTTGRLLSTTGTFPTEMVSMSVSGMAGSIPVMFRESPTLASTGSTSITDLGGGLYDIESFFDIFTELSLDGGETWLAAESPIRMVLVDESAIAVESSSWGKIKSMHR